MPATPLNARPGFWNLARKTIRTQLALLMLAVVLPAFAIAIVFLVNHREEARQVARDKVKILVDNAADRVVATLRMHEVLLSLLATQPQVRSMNAQDCDSLFVHYARLHPEYLNLSTRDLDGNLVCAYHDSAASAEQTFTYPWFQQTVRSGRFHASNVFLDPGTQRWVTVLTMPVLDGQQRPNGVVVLPLDLQKLNEVLLGVVPDNAVVTVTDRQSDILLRSRDPQVWIAKPGAAHDDEGATQGFAVRPGADRVRRLVAFKVLPDSGWRVAAGVPEDEVFAAADAALRNGVLACFGLLLLGLALAWRLAFGILRPLEILAGVASRVAAGETGARAPVHPGRNEVDLVGSAFNAMLDSLSAADTARRESEENLSITLQSIGDGVIATDALGRVTRMNAVAERLTGWTIAAATGRMLVEVFRIVNTDSRQPVLDPVQRVLDSGEVIGLANHTSLLARDGREVQIADSAAPIRDARGEVVGVVLVFSDVSEQYALQRVLVESEARYRALVESSPVGVAVHQQDRLVFCNPTGLKVLGARAQEQLLGRSASAFVHPDDRARVLRRAQELRALGEASPSMELQYLRLDGTPVDVQSQSIAITLHGQPAMLISFMDISERKAAERTLRENEARFRALTELSSDWYWEQDENFRFVRVDGDLDTVAGQSHALRIGKTRWEIGDISLSPAEWAQHRAVVEAHHEFREFHMHVRGNGADSYWVSISGTPIFDAQGVFRGYRGVGRDITEQKLAAGQIHALAFYDALTQLPNRRLLIEQLKKAVATHERSHHQAAVLFIDLDNFKTLNDTLGHEVGDLLLFQVARRLEACVRQSDTVARFGGDEFVVVLADLDVNLTEAAVQAEQVSHKILAAFDPPFELAGRGHRSTPSIGITLFGKDHMGVEDLLKQADLAMYQAKAAGRNTVRVFDRGMQAAVEARAALEADLREALAAQQMLLHFQPVVRADGFVTGAEALLRWEHPVRGRVPPSEFIGLAETTRLILPLGQWVLDQACAQLALWAQGSATAHLTLAVNVSAHQFAEPDFVLHVLQAIERSGADPRRLKLELTESLLAHNMEDVIHKMTLLRERGVDFSLDDFGTGYSSLSYLKRLPLTQLKIDQSFVRDVLDDPNDAAIARTIVALGESLGLAVIAEGVESEGQHRFLLDIGCTAFQGYLFSRPLDIDAFGAYLATVPATAAAASAPS